MVPVISVEATDGQRVGTSAIETTGNVHTPMLCTLLDGTAAHPVTVIV